jgi:hypothetical protein
MSLTDLTGTAIEMAEMGMSVFPLPPLSKVPNNQDNPDSLAVDGHWSVKWKEMSVEPYDVETIRTAWPEYANIGVNCEQSVLWVLDIDTKNGNGVGEFTKLCKVYGDGDWPDTLTVRTASGGYHLYFEAGDHGLANTKGALAKNIDTRGTGGYVVGWGSTVIVGEAFRSYKIVHEAGFEPIPPWLAGLCKTLRRETDAKAAVARARVQWELKYLTPGEVQKRIDGYVDELASQPEGGRNHLLYKTACRFGELAAAGHIDEDTARNLCEVACERNGLAADTGYGVGATFDSGFSRGYSGQP